MKFLGKVFLVVIFAAIVSVVYYWQVLKQPLPFFPPKTQVQNPNQSPTLTYRNENYMFEVVYNKQYHLDQDNYFPNYFKSGGESVANISIPKSNYPETNFGSGSITFATKAKTIESDCATYLTGADTSKKMTKTIIMDAGKFYTDDFSGAAAGTKYDTRLFRIFSSGNCYEMNLTVGIANIGNFEPDTISEITLDAVMMRLEAIAETFKFVVPAVDLTKEETGTLSGQVTLYAQSQDAYDLTQVIVYSQDRSKVISKVSLDQSGNYSVDLPAGTYYVSYTSVNSRIQAPMKKVIIVSDQTVSQDFVIN